MNNEKITIYGDGTQTRSFCFVDDLVDGLIALMFAPEEKAKGEVINLGNPSPITIKELSEEILNLTGSKSEIRYLPLPNDDPLSRCPDITKAKTILNWEPKVSRSDGLKATYEYFKQILSPI